MEHVGGKHWFRAIFDEQSHFSWVVFRPMKIQRDGRNLDPLPYGSLNKGDEEPVEIIKSFASGTRRAAAVSDTYTTMKAASPPRTFR